ncbi:MAG: ATP-dependent RNA helicase DbpA [Desulfotalea sp.]|nr:MAG: ATP-dependent RNA helicase DbpA [Desulfotalea sp.]
MTDVNFSSLSLSQPVLHNLNELGFLEMTPIQAQSLPHILIGRDVLAQAKTGSGKTAAFGLGLLSKLNVEKYRVQSLVLCPTRELADQVAKELRRLARATHNVKILTLCGGVAFGPQHGSLQHGAHVIVGTPGRVLQHLVNGNLSLKDLELLVLDEADRMLDMGFVDDIGRIISHGPAKRQTLLFSATYPDAIVTLSSSIQTDAIKIKTTSEEADNKIVEYFYQTTKSGKIDALMRVMARHTPKSMLVFCATKIEARIVAEDLVAGGIDAIAIHGDLEQYERTDVLVRFMNKSCSVLVATDVAARGIDIKELELVVNYDLPQSSEIYTHRIGRTGRAGKEGIAVTLYTAREAYGVERYRDGGGIFEEADSLAAEPKFTLLAPNCTLVIEGGKKNKMRPGDILGALTGDAGIAGKHIGKIDIYDRQSYVAIERDLIDTACAQLKKGKIKGKTFPIWILGREEAVDCSNVWGGSTGK